MVADDKDNTRKRKRRTIELSDDIKEEDKQADKK